MDVVNLLFYREQKKAEDYMTLQSRLAGIQPQLARIFLEGELKPGGMSCDPPCYVKFVLTGDKPFIRHVLGMRSHNAHEFGAPYCCCSDRSLYDFTFNEREHYGSTTFESLCHRAHVPVWQALGQPEPSEWQMACPDCKEVKLKLNKRFHSLGVDSHIIDPPPNKANINTGKWSVARGEVK